MLADYDDDCEIKISVYYSYWFYSGDPEHGSDLIETTRWYPMIPTHVNQGEDGTIYLGAIDG
jgi:hypothetical protein